MKKVHVVKQGDCLSCIGYRYGLFPQTIWDAPENSALKNTRKNPNVLLPNDRLVIPEKRIREESCATEQRHRFRRKGVPEWLRLKMILDGEPMVNLRYILKVDGNLFSGSTDAEGMIDHRIQPDAKKAQLYIGEEQNEYHLDLGHLDPPEKISGIQARLNNLGYEAGEVNGKMNTQTKGAIERFQHHNGFKITGEADGQTISALEDAHDV